MKQYYNVVQEMQCQTSPRNAQNQENLSCQIKNSGAISIPLEYLIQAKPLINFFVRTI